MIVALCGFMGAGKSTIGKKIHNKLGIEFIDLDDYIVSSAGMSVADIFAAYGESGFRKIEIDALKEVIGSEADRLVSLGGGTLERAENVKILKERAAIVYISVPFGVCYTRIRNTDRPLVKALSESELRARYEARDKRFRECADYVVENRKSSQAADEIIGIINDVNIGRNMQ